MLIEWSERSFNDLQDIFSYIARDSKNNPVKFINELIEAAQVLEGSSLIGRKVPELDDDSVRELIHQNYRIVYRCHASRIVVLTVFEGHKLFQ